MSAEINDLASTSHKTSDESQNDKQNEENEMAAMPSSTNDKKKSRKRKIKRFAMDLSKFSTEAKELQRREKERLERLDKNKQDFDIYKPLIAPNSSSTTTRREEENRHEFEEKEEDILEISAIDDEHDDDEEDEDNDEDDDLFIENVIQKKADIEYIEVSSEEEEENGPTTSSSSNAFNNKRDLLQRPQFNAVANWQYQQAQMQKYHFLNKNAATKRQRRHSSDYDTKEMTAEGRLLINAGKPPADPDVFVAEHLTQVLQPHQIGGVKFMYDNVIECLETFDKSDGNGCILAHSMGLGKTIQAITFIEIFIRVTKRNRVLIICPVNVLQNWSNEFAKWMPKNTDAQMEMEDGQGQQQSSIRDWEVFLLSDSAKTHEARVQLIDDWHNMGGVLLIGYEMFRLLIQQENGTAGNAQNGRGNVRKKATSKRQKQEKRTVWDLEEDLAKLTEEDRQKMTDQMETNKMIKRALLSPGPDLVVCDEGHRIKNLNTEVANALSAIYTKRRIVLTGYPLQNNLMEYYCMVDFVRPSYLGTKKEFLSIFEKPIRNGQCIDSTKRDMKLARQRIHVLTNLLRGFVQRRTQHLLKKILPESREYVLLLRKSPIQHALYRAFHHWARAHELAGDTSFNPLKGFAICMKIVNHPDLLYQAVLKKRKEQESSSGKEEENGKANIEENEGQKTSKKTTTIEEEGPTTSSNLPAVQVHYVEECSTSTNIDGPYNSSSQWPTNPATARQSTHLQNVPPPFNTPPPIQFYPNQPTPIPPIRHQFGPNQQQNGGGFDHFQHHHQYFPPPPPIMPPMNSWGQNNGSNNHYFDGGNGSSFGWQNGPQQNHQTFSGGQNQPQHFGSSRQFFPPPQSSYGSPPPPSNHLHQMPHQNYNMSTSRVPNYNFFQPPSYQQQRPPQNQQQYRQFFQMPSTSTARPPPTPTPHQYMQPPQNYPSHRTPTSFFNINNGNGPNRIMSPPLPYHKNYPATELLNNGNGTTNNFGGNNCSHQTATIGGKMMRMDEGRSGMANCRNDSDGNNNRDIFKGTFLDNEDEQQSQQSVVSSENGTGQQPGPSSKTTQKENKTPKKKPTTKEVNDLLSDEFLLEDGSISFEWAEPGLKDYSLGLLENSSKLFIAMQIISETLRRGEKLLLFSQSVVTLNLIETFLKNQEIFGADWTQNKFIKNKTYCRFDGTTTGSDREKLIKRFNEDPELRLFLISTKAGSLGVNLVSANRVIIFDVSWNPCHDAQAICRIYRYGQKRKTFIYRLIMGNSMEKQVFNRQISKQGLQKRVIDEQMIDANVTTREVQNLMEYDETLDVFSNEKTTTKIKMKPEENGTKSDEHDKDDEFGLDDSLLMDLLETNRKWFLETPFLHESMMLEREDGLSQEEKHEAELLYEREKRGLNFPADADAQAEIEAMNRRMGFAPPPTLASSITPSLLFQTQDGGHRLTQTAPFPKNLELATDMQKQLHLQHQQYLEATMRANQIRQQEFSIPKPESDIVILKEVTLPKVNVKAGDVPDYTVYPGQKMKMFNSPRGTYFRTTGILGNIVLDATKVPPSVGRFYKVITDGRTVQQQNTHNNVIAEEVIQIDD